VVGAMVAGATVGTIGVLVGSPQAASNQLTTNKSKTPIPKGERLRISFKFNYLLKD
jgi:hypothetical protein